MKASPRIAFPPFSLDPVNECLWRNGEPLALTPKAYAVWRVLIDHAGQLVTKEALLQTVWPRTYVTDTVLKVCIDEIRKVLGNDAKSPRFIETAHRRGYRFIAKGVSSQQEEENQKAKVEDLPLPSHFQHLAPMLVGRDAELSQLHGLLGKALHGERQLVFVTGEAGIGKTTLIDAFRQRVESKDRRLAPTPQASGLSPHPRGSLVDSALRTMGQEKRIFPFLMPWADCVAVQKVPICFPCCASMHRCG